MPIHVHSEIGPLKKVMLHRPGEELLNLAPDDLERLLFDDIPFLEVAQQEHDTDNRYPRQCRPSEPFPGGSMTGAHRFYTI